MRAHNSFSMNNLNFILVVFIVVSITYVLSAESHGAMETEITEGSFSRALSPANFLEPSSFNVKTAFSEEYQGLTTLEPKIQPRRLPSIPLTFPGASKENRNRKRNLSFIELQEECSRKIRKLNESASPSKEAVKS